MKPSKAPALLDTSFLVRYLTGDPPSMAERAAEVIDSEAPLILSEIALLETAHVLRSFYGVPRPEIVDALLELVQKQNMQTTDLPKTRVLEALRLCRDSSRHSLPDAFLWAQALEHGAAAIYSFDRHFPSEGPSVRH
jgi:predicted nucleic acid-binding protein